MTKKAFTVDTGLLPNHNGVDMGHTTAQFNDVHLSGDIAMAANTVISIGGVEQVTGGGSSVSPAKAIAFSIALG